MLDMLKLRKAGLSHALGAAMALAAFAPGLANAGDRAGVLQCRLSGNDISVLVENQGLDCLFQDDDEGLVPAHYIGKLTKVGANITVNGPGEIAWGVVAATGHLGPGALAGAYAGPNTSVKVGVGGGGALLVGGSDNTVSLQPLQLEAGSGLGVTAGIESLTLVYVPDQPVPHFKHRHLITK
jgi:hypothetical protein